MRIITGSARGAKLITLEGEATRPTAERTKEAIFSMIQFDIEGRRVLDLFAGSGQLALEALSRGAAEAVLCDSSKDAAAIINKNAIKTRLLDKVKVHVCDSYKLIPKLGSEKFDIIFLDPPYALNLIPGALKLLVQYSNLKPTSIIVCESSQPEDVFGGDSQLEGRFIIKKKAKYGAAFVTIMSPMEETI